MESVLRGAASWLGGLLAGLAESQSQSAGQNPGILESWNPGILESWSDQVERKREREFCGERIELHSWHRLLLVTILYSILYYILYYVLSYYSYYSWSLFISFGLLTVDC